MKKQSSSNEQQDKKQAYKSFHLDLCKDALIMDAEVLPGPAHLGALLC